MQHDALSNSMQPNSSVNDHDASGQHNDLPQFFPHQYKNSSNAKRQLQDPNVQQILNVNPQSNDVVDLTGEIDHAPKRKKGIHIFDRETLKPKRDTRTEHYRKAHGEKRHSGRPPDDTT